MRIMLIFWGDITCNPLQGPAPKHGPPAAWTRPHGAPRPTPCRASAAAHPPWTPCQPGPARERHFFLNPPRACSAVQPGVFRGSELRFGLTIIPVIDSPTLTFAPTAGRGEAGDGDCDHRAPEPSCPRFTPLRPAASGAPLPAALRRSKRAPNPPPEKTLTPHQ